MATISLLVEFCAEDGSSKRGSDMVQFVTDEVGEWHVSTTYYVANRRGEGDLSSAG